MNAPAPVPASRLGTLMPARMEVPTRGKRPGYRWVDGWKILTATGELQPYFRTKREARQAARDLGITLTNGRSA